MRYSIIATGFLTCHLSLCSPVLADDTLRFPIRQFLIQGNTLLSNDDLNTLVTPFTGDNKVYGDIQKALEAVENSYRAHGYGAVQVHIPEQDISSGMVQMNVIETKLGGIVTDIQQKYFDRDNILASLPSLKVGQSPNTFAIANNVQLINENPAKKVEVVMALGEVAGQIDATVKVKEEDPVSTVVFLENSGNASTGNSRIGGTVSHANLMNRDQVLSASYITSLEKPDQVHIYAINYQVPIFTWNDSIGMSITHSDVSAGVTQIPTGNLAFAGKGTMISAKYNHHLSRQGTYSHKVTAGLDQKRYDNTCAVNGNDQACGSSGEDIEVLPLTLAYQGALIKPGLMTDFSIGTSMNQGGSGNEQFQKVLPNRQASSNFTIHRAQANLLSLIGDTDWQWRLAIQTQKTDSALIPSEQIGLAGTYTLRGLNERRLTADNGIALTAELYTSDQSDWLGANRGNLRWLTFVDHVSGNNNQTTGDSLQNLSATSVGVGARYNYQRDWVVRLDYGRLVDVQARTANGQTSSLVNDYQNTDRFHASLMVKF